MKIITFKHDLVEAWRRGENDFQTPLVSLEIDLSTLTEEQRELIGKHLWQTDKGLLVVYDPELVGSHHVVPLGGHPGGDLVVAKRPTLGSLLEALTSLEFF